MSEEEKFTPGENQIAWLRDCNAAGFDPVLEIQKLRDEAMLLRQDVDKWIGIATQRAIKYGEMAWAAHRHLSDLRSIDKIRDLEVAWLGWFEVHHAEVQHLIDAERSHRDGLDG